MIGKSNSNLTENFARHEFYDLEDDACRNFLENNLNILIRDRCLIKVHRGLNPRTEKVILRLDIFWIANNVYFKVIKYLRSTFLSTKVTSVFMKLC